MKKRDIWISVAIIAAACLAFYFFSQQKGYIRIDAPGFETDMNLRRGWLSKTVTISGSEPVKVRAGAYKPERAVVRMEKDEHTWWSIICRNGPWGKLATINVAGGNTTILKLGPPLTVQADVQRKGRAVSIGLSMIGQAGEHWSAEVLTSKGPLPAPKVRIVDETGEVLASGKFEYG